MSEFQHIKAQYDLRRIVEQDLGPAPSQSTRYSKYKCPFHQERHGYSLSVWADGYHCFGKCQRGGDLFDWMMNFHHITFAEVLVRLGEQQTHGSSMQQPAPAICSRPPDDDWQEAARQVVEVAEETLWSLEGEPALTYLLEQRGLNAATIRQAHLGYVPGDFRGWRKIAGLQVPCGILIPWFGAGQIWAVKVRRATGTPKYVQIAGGSSHGLYNADGLDNHNAALFCEGEFDTLLVQQEAGSLLSPVTLGSAASHLAAIWAEMLTGKRRVFVTYDRDTAGERAAQRLLQLSPRFHALPLPHSKDITAFHLAGGDIYEWISSASVAIPDARREVCSVPE